MPPGERVGFAVVGIGRLTLEEIMPAFGNCQRAYPAAFVSGTMDKAKLAAKQYGIKESAVYSYENFDEIANNPDVKVVYIVLPNSMHREFVERAAKAGKHVLCEKPMATNAADAQAMVEACRKANVKLMVAYRCQYEPYNREVQRLVRSGELGQARFIETSNTQVQGTPDQWRLKKAMAGGGSLPDIGLYCLNTTRAILGEEPIEVFAREVTDKTDPRFKEVENNFAFMLRFPSGVIANCATSYDAHNSKDLTVRLEKGWIKLDGAYAYHGKKLVIAKRDGNAEAMTEKDIGEKNQFALEMDHMAQCVTDNITPRTPGEEGLQDHIIMEALYQSAATGQPIALKASAKIDATRGPALLDDA